MTSGKSKDDEQADDRCWCGHSEGRVYECTLCGVTVCDKCRGLEHECDCND